jgi:hypothetical protein
MSGDTPFERGEKAGMRGDAPPAFPTPDSSWAERLFNRGWECGAGKRIKEQSQKGGPK